jgi:hypothetical protein
MATNGESSSKTDNAVILVGLLQGGRDDRFCENGIAILWRYVIEFVPK